MIKSLVYLFIGYMVSAGLSDAVFLNPHMTDFLSLYVWAWLLFWPIMAFIKLGFYALLIWIVVWLAVFFYEHVTGSHWGDEYY